MESQLLLKVSEKSRLLLLVVILTNLLISYASDLIKCSLKQVEDCDLTGNSYFKTNLTIKTVDSMQYVDGTTIIKKPLDNNIRFNTTVEKLTIGKYLYLFSFNEAKACNGIGKYWGEFLYELERMGQMMPGMCPMQNGTYHWHNAPIHLEKNPTLASFPFGTLRFTCYLYEKDDNVYGCLMFVLEIYIV